MHHRSKYMPLPRFVALIALIASIAIPFTARADEPKPSPRVKRILDKAASEVKKNRQEFDKANEKPLGEARKALEELSTKLIKDGKAEEATAVLKQVGTLEADVMRMANAPAPMVGGGGAVPKKPVLEKMRGQWQRPGVGKVVIDRDTLADHKGDGGRLTPSSENSAEVVLGSNWRWQLHLVGDDMVAVREWNAEGRQTGGIVLERIK
jgi:hypothetical protein